MGSRNRNGGLHVMVVPQSSGGGGLARTTLTFAQPLKTVYLGDNKWATLVRVEIFTGFTHQIRCALSYSKHTLLGDTLYGGVKPPSSRCFYLHHFACSFVLEENKIRRLFCVPPPSDFWLPLGDENTQAIYEAFPILGGDEAIRIDVPLVTPVGKPGKQLPVAVSPAVISSSSPSPSQVLQSLFPMQTFLGNAGLAQEWAEFQAAELMRTRDNYSKLHPNGRSSGEDRQVGGCMDMLRSKRMSSSQGEGNHPPSKRTRKN